MPFFKLRTKGGIFFSQKAGWVLHPSEALIYTNSNIYLVILGEIFQFWRHSKTVYVKKSTRRRKNVQLDRDYTRLTTFLKKQNL